MRYWIGIVAASVSFAEGREAPSLDDEPNRASNEPEFQAVNTGPALPANVYGLGFRTRYITIPGFLFAAFTDEATSMHSYAIAGEFTWWKRGRHTLLSSFEFASYSPEDGNFLGKGENPEAKTDYIQFRDLNMISVDATWVWEHEFSPKIALVWGVGLGAMFPMGQVFRASAQGCTADNAGDESQCAPAGCEDGVCTVSDIDALTTMADPFAEPNDAAFEQELWPVYPLLNLLVGARFQLHRHFQMRIDGGFHNALFLGAAATYLM